MRAETLGRGQWEHATGAPGATQSPGAHPPPTAETRPIFLLLRVRLGGALLLPPPALRAVISCSSAAKDPLALQAQFFPAGRTRPVVPRKAALRHERGRWLGSRLPSVTQTHLSQTDWRDPSPGVLHAAASSPALGPPLKGLPQPAGFPEGCHVTAQALPHARPTRPLHTQPWAPEHAPHQGPEHPHTCPCGLLIWKRHLILPDAQAERHVRSQLPKGPASTFLKWTGWGDVCKEPRFPRQTLQGRHRTRHCGFGGKRDLAADPTNEQDVRRPRAPGERATCSQRWAEGPSRVPPTSNSIQHPSSHLTNREEVPCLGPQLTWWSQDATGRGP